MPSAPSATPALGFAADAHEHIEVRGARENDLKNVSIDIPSAV